MSNSVSNITVAINKIIKEQVGEFKQLTDQDVVKMVIATVTQRIKMRENNKTMRREYKAIKAELIKASKNNSSAIEAIKELDNEVFETMSEES